MPGSSTGEGITPHLPAAALRGWLSPQPDRLQRVLDARLAIYGERFADTPSWPALALPRAILGACGADPQRGQAVLSGCALFFLAADVVDDAQDGDLPADLAWPEAVNAGHSLLFAALGAFSAAAPETPVAEAMAQAGQALAGGQALDLGLDWDSEPDEDLVMTAIRGKAGASMALYARMAAFASGLGRDAARQWAGIGERTGMAVQLRSDLADVEDAGSRDLKARRLTLPVAYGLRRAPEAVRAALESGDQRRALAALRQSGAITFVEFKIEAFILEATTRLDAMGLPESAAQEVQAVLRSCTRDPSAL